MIHHNAFPDDAELFGPVVPDPPRRRGWRRAAVAGAVVAVLGTSGATYAFNASISGGGTQPEDVLAGGAFGFMKVDLDPAPDQKIALYQLSKKLPHVLDDPGSEAGVKDSVLARLFELQDELSYPTDVKPWLGERAGLAVYPAAWGDKEPRVALALQVTDAAAADAAMKKDGGDMGWTFRDGYLVLSDTKGRAEGLVAREPALSLANQTTYRQDVARLDGLQVAIYWADLARVCLAAATAAGVDGSRLRELEESVAGKRWGLVAGLHATPQFLEVQAQGVGTWDWRAAQPGTNLAGRMPADSWGVLSIAGLSRLDPKLWDQFWAGATSEPDGAAFAAALRERGVSLPADVSALLGDESVLGIANDALDYPALTVRTRGGDQARATEVMRTLLRLGELADSAVGATTADGFVVGSDPRLVQASKGSAAPLAGTPAYQLAVPEAPDAVVVLFVNLRRVLEDAYLTPAEKKAISGFEAFGLTAWGDTGMRARLTVR